MAPSKGEFCSTILPGSPDAMVVDWRGDNAGPPSTARLLITDFQTIQVQFPNAKIIPSTFDQFIKTVQPVKDKLPVITSEIGDTWIHGVASDPLKVAKTRNMLRLASQCLDSGQCKLSDNR